MFTFVVEPLLCFNSIVLMKTSVNGTISNKNLNDINAWVYLLKKKKKKLNNSKVPVVI